MNHKRVVTCFLQSNHRILLLRRSERVATNRGKWSAVSGYLEGTEQPLTRAVTEVVEEVGLAADQIDLVRQGEVMRAFDGESDTNWVVHPFLFRARSEKVRLDWENVEYKWIEPDEIESYDTVPKLRESLERVLYDLRSEPASLAHVLAKLKRLEEDKVHGASFIGRQAITLLSQTAEASDAKDAEALFSHLLLITMRLRRVQPAMANVWNLTGKLLRLIDRTHRKQPIEEVRSLIKQEAARVLENAEEDSENVSRTAVQFLPRNGFVLTHSFSSAVLRTLELGFKSGRNFHIYATESYPGFEGKQLTKELIALRTPVTLIADSAVISIIQNASLILVGADSVLSDGSLVHKTGTREIATAAKQHGIPLYSACETVKFSVQDLLGDRPEISEKLFDITPPDLVAAYITEDGLVSPANVEPRLKSLQADVYP